MFVGFEIIQNILMGIPPVARLAQRSHSTGINADPDGICRVYELYTRWAPVVGKDILEIGTGQTLEVLERAKADGARSCTAIDIIDYRSPKQASGAPVTFVCYDGKTFPLASACMDLIWSYTAFEHLRYPAVTVRECFRLLRPGGTMVALIDLGDHSFYGVAHPQPDKLFDCLRYPEWLWRLMRWNRSSYVNRLRQSEWRTLFDRAGFVRRQEEKIVDQDIVRLLPQLTYLHRYDYEDAVTAVLTVCLEKPSAP